MQQNGHELVTVGLSPVQMTVHCLLSLLLCMFEIFHNRKDSKRYQCPDPTPGLITSKREIANNSICDWTSLSSHISDTANLPHLPFTVKLQTSSSSALWDAIASPYRTGKDYLQSLHKGEYDRNGQLSPNIHFLFPLATETLIFSGHKKMRINTV